MGGLVFSDVSKKDKRVLEKLKPRGVVVTRAVVNEAVARGNAQRNVGCLNWASVDSLVGTVVSGMSAAGKFIAGMCAAGISVSGVTYC